AFRAAISGRTPRDTLATFGSRFIRKCVAPVHLNRAEGMLHRFPSLAHSSWVLIKPALHRCQPVLRFQAGDPAPLGRCAVVLDQTRLAGV
ncbi:MAG TPA: hypothetical protein VK434_21730, partial [Microvirga sp.]|nr:hypothetical protein [Microvirga sp.]